MRKFLCYDTNDAASGKIGVNNNGVLSPNATVPSTNGTTYQQLVTDGEGNVKWEDRLAYSESRICVSTPEAEDASEYVKVSDDFPTGSYDIGTRIYIIDSDEDDYEETIMVSNGEVIADSDYEPKMIVALHDNVTFLSEDDWSITLPEKGTYFAKYSNYFITGVVLGDSNVPEITWDGSLIGGKKIEQIYIPDEINEYINNSDKVLKICTGDEVLPSSIFSDWASVTYGDGKFVAVNNRKIAAYSTDGIIWTKTTLSSDRFDLVSVTYGDGKFVAVSRNSNIAVYSTDGITWTRTTLPSDSTNWSSVTYGDGKFVAVTDSINDGSNIAAYSTDGITWTRTTLPVNTYWKSVTYGDGKFVAVASGKRSIIAYSTDGITWTKTTFLSEVNWSSVTYGDGKFVAVAGEYIDSDIAAYSTDGITWTQTTLLSVSSWCSVTYGGGKFICMATDGSIEYSNDGSIWKHTDVKFITVSGDDVTDYINTLINILIDAKLGG